MSDDIVTRLRVRLMSDGYANPEDTSDAVDEIERLRLIVSARDVQIRRLAWEMSALEAPQ